jgi:tripartite-type tricarboxylate transporter receptor subunit TctC
LIALAKARPGQLNYASISTGSSNHLAAELFKAMAGVNIVRVSYKATATAISDLISGQVQVMFATSGAAMPQVKSGRLTALGVTSAEPSALLPGLPTIAASGLPDYEATSIFGMFAPAKTSAAIIGRLNRDAAHALSQADVKDKLFNAGVEAVASTPQELATVVKSEMARMGKVIKDAGIREE